MPHRKPAEPTRAFTLIELLVVVAIIVILIALMLPSLGRAREQGRRTVCAANLKGIGFAIQMYSDANGVIPPFSSEIGDFQWAISPNGFDGYYNDRCYYHAWTILLGNHNPPGWGNGYPKKSTYPLNLAKLVQDGSLPNPKMLYCPSGEISKPGFKSADWANPTANGVSLFYWYSYNPYPKNNWHHEMPGNDWGDYPKYTKLIEFGSHPIALDRINLWGASDIAHASAGPGWNMLFSDGHVEYRITPQLRTYALSLPLWGTNCPMGDDWEYLLNGVTMLENAQ